MMAMIAISGIRKPPRTALASSISAPLRADSATAGDEEGVADWANTGAPAMETMSAAAKDAFLKLILNSLLSWPFSHCHSDPALTTPKFGRDPSLCAGVAALQTPLGIDRHARRNGPIWRLSEKAVKT